MRQPIIMKIRHKIAVNPDDALGGDCKLKVLRLTCLTSCLVDNPTS